MSEVKTKPVEAIAEPKVPADLLTSLKANYVAYELWKDITPLARRDWISWVEQAKQSETRLRRIEQTNSKLIGGKRRPCCFAVVPMNLYKALGTNPKAKATWSDLSATERRDYSDWIEAARAPETSNSRVEEVLAMLANGQRRP